jgi:hypothetical protein
MKVATVDGSPQRGSDPRKGNNIFRELLRFPGFEFLIRHLRLKKVKTPQVPWSSSEGRMEPSK